MAGTALHFDRHMRKAEAGEMFAIAVRLARCCRDQADDAGICASKRPYVEVANSNIVDGLESGAYVVFEAAARALRRGARPQHA